MTFVQLVCLQLLLIVVSNQILASPIVAESTDGIMNTNRNFLSPHDYGFDNLDQMTVDVDNYENIRQHLLNRLSKRRAQAKANLAGLWGVPTRY